MDYNRPLSSYTVLELLRMFHLESEENSLTSTSNQTTVSDGRGQTVLDASTPSIQTTTGSDRALWNNTDVNNCFEKRNEFDDIKYSNQDVSYNFMADNLNCSVGLIRSNQNGFDSAFSKKSKNSMEINEQLKLCNKNNLIRNEQLYACSSLSVSNGSSKPYTNHAQNLIGFKDAQSSSSLIKSGVILASSINQQVQSSNVTLNLQSDSSTLNQLFPPHKSLNIIDGQLDSSTSRIGHNSNENSYDLRRICTFCKNNRETPSMWQSHTLRDVTGRIRCPVLRAYVCPRCGDTGDTAHTQSHCPSADPREKNRARFLKRRTSTPSPTVIKKN